MDPYKFETDQLGISASGFHLLRNNFNYETIDFAAVDKISIETGRQVNNWMILFGFGVLLFSSGMFWATKVIYEFFFADNIHRFYVEQFVLPVLPIATGGFSIYISLKNGLVMIVSTRQRVKRFALEKLTRDLQTEELISFLREHDLTKNKLNIQSKIGAKSKRC